MDARLEEYLVRKLGEGVRLTRGALMRHVSALAEYYEPFAADDLEYQCLVLAAYLDVESPWHAGWFRALLLRAGLATLEDFDGWIDAHLP